MAGSGLPLDVEFGLGLSFAAEHNNCDALLLPTDCCCR